jgi:hemerythrin-like metal-binding protein
MATMTAPLMTWKNDWEVGVREIDAQHRQLVSLLNQLHAAMKDGKGKAVVGAILDSLIYYTKAHFSTEERLMQQCSYRDLVAHQREHNLLTAKVLDFQRTFKSGGMVITADLMHFLSKWMQEHICGSDKKYAPFLHAHGIR